MTFSVASSFQDVMSLASIPVIKKESISFAMKTFYRQIKVSKLFPFSSKNTRALFNTVKATENSARNDHHIRFVLRAIKNLSTPRTCHHAVCRADG